MSDNYILDYWKWIDTLSPKVRQVVVECWDETGRPVESPLRPVESPMRAVSMLLDCSDNFEEFLNMYLEMMNSTGEFDKEDCIQKSHDYYQLYIAGMKRIIRFIPDWDETDRGCPKKG